MAGKSYHRLKFRADIPKHCNTLFQHLNKDVKLSTPLQLKSAFLKDVHALAAFFDLMLKQILVSTVNKNCLSLEMLQGLKSLVTGYLTRGIAVIVLSMQPRRSHPDFVAQEFSAKRCVDYPKNDEGSYPPDLAA